MRELKLWIYTSSILGHSRVVMVADHTVGGAKARIGGSHGCPSASTGIPASTPGFPAWVAAPGVWFGIVPILKEEGVYPQNLRGLDRFSQEHTKKAPSVLPVDEGAFLRAEDHATAYNLLRSLIADLLEANHLPTKVKAA